MQAEIYNRSIVWNSNVSGQDQTKIKEIPYVLTFLLGFRYSFPILVLSRFSSGLFRAMFAIKEKTNGKEIHR